MGAVPPGQRRIKSQILDNVYAHAAGSKHIKRVSAPGMCTTFDPVIEHADEQDSPPAREHPVAASRGSSVVMAASRLQSTKRRDDRMTSVLRALSSPSDETEEWAKVNVLLTSLSSFNERLICQTIFSIGECL